MKPIVEFRCTEKEWKQYWIDAHLSKIVSHYVRLTRKGRKMCGSLERPIEFYSFVGPDFEIIDEEGYLSVEHQQVDYKDIGRFIELLDGDSTRRYWEVVMKFSGILILGYAFQFVYNDGSTEYWHRKEKFKKHV